MPVTWGLQDPVLTLAVTDVVANRDIELAMREAVAELPSRTGIRLLWDARESVTPVSADDMEWRFEIVSSLVEKGVFSRVALVLRSQGSLTLELARQQLQRGLPTVECRVFTDAADARRWLVAAV